MINDKALNGIEACNLGENVLLDMLSNIRIKTHTKVNKN